MKNPELNKFYDPDYITDQIKVMVPIGKYTQYNEYVIDILLNNSVLENHQKATYENSGDQLNV